ncbi:MAG: MBOAT family protein [Pseudoflavonifractor sp.]|nr:MBOAT family protein [Alloprevotella sp.]MCM1117514.1 MBOAT family protein [Pseudoflavonifractor sp.]
MVFSDLFFLFVFLPAFMICYRLAGIFDTRDSDTPGGVSPRSTHPRRNIVIVLFSLIFYAWGEPVYVFLMLLSVAINYLAGLWIASRQPGKSSRKVALIIGITANVLIIGVFKYAGFIAANLASLGVPVNIPAIGLPIGISFYTFQSISYLVDVYRTTSPVQRRYSDLLLYISMFPQLIAGPIVRYDTVAREINTRSASADDVADGVFRFMIGLGKKVVIANQFSEIADGFLAPAALADISVGGAWIGIIAFTFQIYFDFSGYSDMAIGIGRCLGFHFNENFDHPYVSRSITEFWRRWHMSLGSFFRDYVYIPLGGNRSHQTLNILAVWVLTGLWHGASWNFVIWGLFFAVILMVEKRFILPRANDIPAPALHFYAMVLVIAGWGIFYFDNLNLMGRFFQAFLGYAPGGLWSFACENALRSRFWLWVAAILFSMPIRRWAADIPHRVFGRNGTVALSIETLSRIAVASLLLIISVALLIGATNNAFLYTRF